MSVSHSRSRVANAAKRARRRGLDPATEPEVLAARQELAEANLDAYIRRVVDAAPPLSTDAVCRLQALLDAAQIEKHLDPPLQRRVEGGDRG